MNSAILPLQQRKCGYDRKKGGRKALKWLDDNKIDYTLIDIKDDHPDEETLRKYHKKSGLPLRKFLTPAGSFAGRWGCQRNCWI